MAIDAIFSLPYLGNIEFYKTFLSYSSPQFDLGEHYIKQSFRNRTYIFGANGVLPLSVPVVKLSGQKQTMADVCISYDIDWQRIQLEAIKSAYGSAPFFEYYFDEISSIIASGHQYLHELSLALHEEILALLQIEKNTVIRKEYYQGTEDDFRQYLQPKHKHDFAMESYTQVFSEKHAFVPNLSIIDLLFNEGPNAESYITA